LTFTVSVTGPAGAAQPTGTVLLSDASKSNAVVCVGPLTLVPGKTSSAASCQVSTLSLGGHKITATYTPAANETNYVAAGPSTPQALTITKATPVISIGSSLNPSNYGDTVVLSVSVANASVGTGAFQPTGTVSFLDGTTALSCTNANASQLTQGTSSSTATCSISTLASGSHNITVSYTPAANDGNYNAVKGPTTPFVQEVKQTSATTVVTSSGTPSVYGKIVTFTATVTGVATAGAKQPTGTVGFTENGKALTCTNAGAGILTPGTGSSTATCDDSTLTAGPHSIIGTYVPNAQSIYLAGKPSDPFVQTISGAPAKPSVTSSPGSAIVNQAVTFTATLAFTGSTAPTGGVTFAVTNSGGTVVPACIGSFPVTTSIKTGSPVTSATCTANSLPGVDSYSVTATYGGDQYFAPSAASSPLIQFVIKGATSQVLAPASATVVATNPITFSSTVSQADLVTLVGTISPGGSVSFFSSDFSSGTITNNCAKQSLAAIGTATPRSSKAGCAVSFPSSLSQTGGTPFHGTFTVNTSYQVDSNFNAPGTAPSSGSITVQNFQPALSVQDTLQPVTNSVTLIQGFGNRANPFDLSVITLSATSLSGFGDSLTADHDHCTLSSTSVSTGSSSGIICKVDTLLPNTGGHGSSSGTEPVATFNLQSSIGTPIGTYTLTVTPIDAKATNLMNSATITVNVIQTAPATVSTGSSTQASLSVATAVASASLSCGDKVFNADTQTIVAATSLGLSCTGFTVTPPATPGGLNTVTFTITKGQTAQLVTHSNLVLAAMAGTPLFFLIGLVSRAKSRHQAFLRYFGMTALLFAGLQGLGCGGGFNSTIPKTAGTFDLEIVSTDATTQVSTIVGVVQLTVPR